MNGIVFGIGIQCKLMKICYLLIHFEIMVVGTRNSDVIDGFVNILP